MAKAKATAQSSLERRIADLHISRYLRPYRRALACFVVVVLPDGVSSLCWKDAALAWSGKEEDWRFQEPVIVASDKALTDVSIARGRMVVLIERDDRDEYLEHTTIAAADAVVDIAEIDPKLIQLAFREMVGSSITHAEATVLAAMTASRRRLVSFAGRPVSATIARLAAANEKEVAVKATEKAVTEKKTGGSRLEDLHGYGEAKDWGLELARDLADYRAGIISWSDVDGGLLLSGPPGTGKTTFAKALAETCGVGLVVGSYSSWISHGEGHQGDLLKAMRGAFDTARKLAPCIVFVDEIDNFVQRGSIGHGKSDEWMRGVVNGLLELLDGAMSREGVIVIGACNDASGIDMALRRSGRLDRHIELGMPDASARMHILRNYLGVDLDLKPYLRRTEGLSGADLERAARDARRLARRERTEISHHHIAAALPARAPRPRDSIRLAACHEIGHAVVGAILEAGRLLHVYVTKEYDPKASASVAGAAVFRVDPHEHRTAKTHRDLVCAKLAGMAAEEMYVGSHGEGCVADLEEATALATYMYATLGMGDTLSSAGHRDPAAFNSARMMDPALAREVEALLQEQAARAREILEKHRDAVDELVELLILRGRLMGPEVRDTIRSYEAASSLPKVV
ncbi:AAA family ATPase [Agrobacterium pusense]|uniref:AAA family ATPase n=1 Tax=Agrobacterium pusense TaxID=648995 RepID=UPI0010BF045B|nr:AAA family ATPase [Agrobacterium pusense]QCL83380.1 AAA family ATPase [Agrobacterium pusense]